MFKLNGKVMYDSGFHDGNLDMTIIEDRDIADELKRYGKPSQIAGLTYTLDVQEPLRDTPHDRVLDFPIPCCCNHPEITRQTCCGPCSVARHGECVGPLAP